MPHEEWIKTIVGCATSTLGFLFALLVNSYIQSRADERAYRTMLLAIATEADSNAVILKESFRKFFDKGLVLRAFVPATAAQCCSSTLFIKHAKPLEMQVLNAYLRNITLANEYREKAERFWLDPEGKASKEWLNGVIEAWDSNLTRCEESIEQVRNLKSK